MGRFRAFRIVSAAYALDTAAMLKRISLAMFPLALCLVLGACAITPSQDQQVEDAHAEKVIATAQGVLGHDNFSVAYIPDNSAIMNDAVTDGLGAFVGPSNTVKGAAAGLMENYRKGADVVLDGPSNRRTNEAACSALELLDKPMQGLDLVVVGGPSAQLRELAQKYSVTLHSIQVQD